MFKNVRRIWKNEEWLETNFARSMNEANEIAEFLRCGKMPAYFQQKAASPEFPNVLIFHKHWDLTLFALGLVCDLKRRNLIEVP